MELQLAAALKQPGESFSFALEEPVGPQPFGGRTVAFAAPLSVTGRYVFGDIGVAITSFFVGFCGFFVYPLLILCIWVNPKL